MSVITVYDDREDFEEVAKLALHIKPGKATHRATGFIRNNMKKTGEEALVKLELNKAGNYWVSQEGHVWYIDLYKRSYFILPVVVEGKVLERGIEGPCFDYPELHVDNIKEGVGAPRAYTTDETATQLIKHFLSVRDYWMSDARRSRPKLTPEQREDFKDMADGMIFSILSGLDGCSSLPPFYLIPISTAEDIEYSKSMGDNYYPEYCPDDVPQALPGWLHELFHNVEREYEEEKKKYDVESARKVCQN